MRVVVVKYSLTLSDSLFFLPLLSRDQRHGVLSICTEIDRERRPNPPCALRGFEFYSILYVLCFVLDEFDFPSTNLEHEMTSGFLMIEGLFVVILIHLT